MDVPFFYAYVERRLVVQLIEQFIDIRQDKNHIQDANGHNMTFALITNRTRRKDEVGIVKQQVVDGERRHGPHQSLSEQISEQRLRRFFAYGFRIFRFFAQFIPEGLCHFVRQNLGVACPFWT